jgi:hypothetical protein
MSDPISLDELFGQASVWIRAQRAEAAKPKTFRVKDKDTTSSPAALYSNPAYWKRSRGVALLHEETQTILGNFSEYIHLREPGTKKLVREDGPLLVDAVLPVSGEWYISRIAEPPAHREAYHTTQTVFVDLHLDQLRVHSPLVEVVVFLHAGGVDRIELALDTVFAADAGEPEVFLTLPKGTNIREVASRECKIAVRKELKL